MRRLTLDICCSKSLSKLQKKGGIPIRKAGILAYRLIPCPGKIHPFPAELRAAAQKGKLSPMALHHIGNRHARKLDLRLRVLDKPGEKLQIFFSPSKLKRRLKSCKAPGRYYQQ